MNDACNWPCKRSQLPLLVYDIGQEDMTQWHP